MLLRIKYDNSGTMVGFYSGGNSRRGLSKRNLTKLYRHALILGGEDPESVNKFTYHGGKRGFISYQKSFGGVSHKDVAIGSKHAIGSIIDEYTNANKCQLAEAAKRQCDIRDKMEAVLSAKSKQEVEEQKTPQKKRIPGEVRRIKGNISPSEVRKMDRVLRANGLDMEKIRDIDSFHPGFLKCVIDLAANCAVGVSYDSNIMDRAMKYLRGKGKMGKRSYLQSELDSILKANGIEMRKLQDVDKFHPGFSDCVVNLVTSNGNGILRFGKDLVTRAEKYLKNKRCKAGWSKSDNLQMMNQFKQKFSSSKAQLQSRNTYHAPVFNNCSFGSVSDAKGLASDLCGDYGSAEVSKKRRLDNKVVKKKRRFKSAEQLGLKL